MASLTQITWKKRDARDARALKNRHKKTKKRLKVRAEKEVTL